MQNTPFKIFGNVEIIKAVSSNPLDGFRIRGVVLRKAKDEQGETPMMDKMDWSYFDKTQNLLYEHKPATITIDKSKNTTSITANVPEPEDYIGKVLSRTRSADGANEIIEAQLYPSNKKAQDIVKMMKDIELINKQYPKQQKTIGFSIEAVPIQKTVNGKYADKNGNYAGKVISIVVSPTPQDAGTYAEIMEHENNKIAKSLSAGYDVNPATMTDGEALKKESLISNKKSQTKGVRTMRKYKSIQDAHTECITKGMKGKEAQDEATRLWNAQLAEEANTVTGSIEKGIDAALSFIKKSFEPINALLARTSEVETSLIRADIEIKKSFANYEASTEDQPFDGGAAVVAIQKSVYGLQTEQNISNQSIAKAMIAQSEAMQELFGIVKSMATQLSTIQGTSDDTINRVTAIMQGVKKSVAGSTTDPAVLRTLSVDSKQTELNETDRIIKGIPVKRIERFLVDRGEQLGREQGAAYFTAQQNFKVQGLSAINKGMRKEIADALGSFSYAVEN
jgi:hypothetical protein